MRNIRMEKDIILYYGNPAGYVSGGKAICWSKLSTAAFTVTSWNTLTIGANSTGGAFTIT